MAHQSIMRSLASWHIWIGWLAGVPLVLWTLTGLVMVARPIEEVRGNHLRMEQAPSTIPVGTPTALFNSLDARPERPVELKLRMDGSEPVAVARYADGSIVRFASDTGAQLPLLDEGEARALVVKNVAGGERPSAVTAFPASNPPFDLRSPIPVWQVALRDGTHVYVNRETGEIAAVRTRWWRVFDFMWGLHIMDLQTREDTHHPILIIFAIISLVMSIVGCVLMFRRRKARISKRT